MKFFAVLDVSLTMGLTRCYKTEGFFTVITRNGQTKLASAAAAAQVNTTLEQTRRA